MLDPLSIERHFVTHIPSKDKDDGVLSLLLAYSLLPTNEPTTIKGSGHVLSAAV